MSCTTSHNNWILTSCILTIIHCTMLLLIDLQCPDKGTELPDCRAIDTAVIEGVFILYHLVHRPKKHYFNFLNTNLILPLYGYNEIKSFIVLKEFFFHVSFFTFTTMTVWLHYRWSNVSHKFPLFVFNHPIRVKNFSQII